MTQNEYRELRKITSRVPTELLLDSGSINTASSLINLMLVCIGVRKGAVLELASASESKSKPAFVEEAQKSTGRRLFWANHIKPRSHVGFDMEQIVVNKNLTDPGLFERFRKKYESDQRPGSDIVGKLLEYPCEMDFAHEYMIDFMCQFQIYKNGQCIQGQTPFDQYAWTHLATVRCGGSGDQRQLERALTSGQKRWVLPATMRLAGREFPLADENAHMCITGFGIHLKKKKPSVVPPPSRNK